MTDVLRAWQEFKPLIAEGYKVLNKEVTLNLPGPCMPAWSIDKDSGIGSPYGIGAQRIADFWKDCVHKILLGPNGKTTPETNFSPYVSEILHNPFFIPLEFLKDEKLISLKTLNNIYNTPKNNDKIDFYKVNESYQKALNEAYEKSHTSLSKEAFIEDLCCYYMSNEPIPYIADLQAQIPNSIYQKNQNLFLNGFTLGSPSDNFFEKARNWGFKILDPAYFFTSKNKLGKGGLLLLKIFSDAMRWHSGGLRIDHYIGFVNPYLISDNPNIPNGRLYSSFDNPVLKKYQKNTTEEFANITEHILIQAAQGNNLSLNEIYIEDIGNRPPQMDAVIERCGLGRLLVSQFVEIDDDNHIYRLKNAHPNDVATLATHDTESIQSVYKNMSDVDRRKHALKLAQDLRWNYTDSLMSPTQLIRMKWAELLTCPAKRIQSFFTSFTGQEGRYNQPGNPEKWKLRCVTNFESLYFKNLSAGLAYNPFDAIVLAIYARGDDFYKANENLVNRLRQAEQVIFSLSKQSI